MSCVVAIDARTGKRLWHFQEIRHDLWDLDVSAPPGLGTITREGMAALDDARRSVKLATA